MLKFCLTFLMLFLSSLPTLFAQIFTEVTLSDPTAPFEDVSRSVIDHADIDGDGDQDVLLMGVQEQGGILVAKLYTNDGTGTFIEVANTPFKGFHNSTIDFADVDGDGDQDVLITGALTDDAAFLKMFSILYLNDGLGNFTEVAETPFEEEVANAAVAFEDVDNDGDQDVLITGSLFENNKSESITKLYLNDGQGTFTALPETPFETVGNGMITFADIDNDNDQDVLIVGSTNRGRVANLYVNDGRGIFTKVADTPFQGVTDGSVAFTDIDNDGDQDLVLLGKSEFVDGEHILISNLYINDGAGQFTEAADTPFAAVFHSSLAFVDVDNDGDQDALLTGDTPSINEPISKLYLNNGAGDFTESPEMSINAIFEGEVVFFDADGDQDPDLLQSGRSQYGLLSRLYTNDGTGHFKRERKTLFEGIRKGGYVTADVDADGDQDVLVTGLSVGGCIAQLYLNEGGGYFSEVTDNPFTGIGLGDVAFSDIDDDGDQDVLLTGANCMLGCVSKLYTNDGAGNFTEVLNTPFNPACGSRIAFADVDGDQDEDVLLVGGLGVTELTATLYTNDGAGNFTEVPNTPFEAVYDGTILFSDIDGDNDQDLLLSGYSDDDETARLYTNDGTGNFTEVLGLPFAAIHAHAVATEDIDADGDQDLLLVGVDEDYVAYSKLYINNGTGNFTAVENAPFEAVDFGSIAFSDVDGDQDQDVIISGRLEDGSNITKLYLNDGLGNFTEDIAISFPGYYTGDIAFFDMDGDQDQDVLIGGVNEDGIQVTQLFMNNAIATSNQVFPDAFNFEFNLAPNPTSANQLNIHYIASKSNALTIRIFDLQGKLVQQSQQDIHAQTGHFVMDIASLQAGYYFIELDNGAQKGIQQFVVED